MELRASPGASGVGETDDRERLDEVILNRRRGLILVSPGHPELSRSLSDLADALRDRFERSAKMEDLEEAITHNRQALLLRLDNHPDRYISLKNLAEVLLMRFMQLGIIGDLEDAITYHRQALLLRPPGHRDHCTSLCNLAHAILTRFYRLHNMEDLEDSIKCNRRALDLYPSDDPECSLSLNDLGIGLWLRFIELGNMEDLQEAIVYHQQTLDLRMLGHPDRSISLNNLACALSSRFDKLGKMEDLKAAILYYHQALDLRPPGHPSRSSSFRKLATILLISFDKLGEIQELEEAIVCYRESLDLHPTADSDRSSILNNLGLALFTRFSELGKIEDLNEAIMCHQEALHLRPSGHPSRWNSLNCVAVGLSIRFNQLGKMDDLEEVITCYRQALMLCPPGHPLRPYSLGSLASTLHTCFHQHGKMENLDEAIVCYKEALVLRPPGHPDCSMFLHDIAHTLFTQFHQEGKMETLEEAITHHEQALDLRPHGHPSRSQSLNNLAHTLSARFDQLGEVKDMQEAIQHLLEADLSLPTEHPQHVKIRTKLALSYLRQHELSPTSDHYLIMAFALFERAANHTTASSGDCLTAALNWVTTAHRWQHESAVRAYSKVLSLLDRCLVTNLSIEPQHKCLVTGVPISLASDAAARAIEQGQVEKAVELLEQGRTILWSTMGGNRYLLEQLREADAELANHLEMLSAQLERNAMPSHSESMISTLASERILYYKSKMRIHSTLSEEWHHIVNKIQQLDGFTHFLKAVSFPTLQAATTEGPIILVNVSEHRSDAIILHHIGPPVLVSLSKSLPHTLNALFLYLVDSKALDPITSSKRILLILRHLWDLVVHPVIDKLALLGVIEKSRIWWYPTAELCMLPLHAAGPYMPNQNSLPDIYVSSYIPTLSSLIRARTGMVCGPTVPSLVVVGQPCKDFPRAKEEINQLQQFWGYVNTLRGKETNQVTVLSSLQQCSWAHFVCHGHQHIEPLQSTFQLSNGNHISIPDFINAHLSNPEFAFLSACHSIGDIIGTPNEIIPLAAALQFSGFRSVIGTLWAITDSDGPDIVKDFYSYIFRWGGNMADFRESAVALNLATQRMRRRPGMTLDRWVNFVHIGA